MATVAAVIASTHRPAYARAMDHITLPYPRHRDLRLNRGRQETRSADRFLVALRNPG